MPSLTDPTHSEISEHTFLKTKALQPLFDKLRKIAYQQGPILIEGESGTGKTSLAREFHHFSPRKNKPLLELGAGEMPSGFVESILFGHTKDAYTGAHSFQRGILAEANGGTLIINDIDQLPKKDQSRLLRFLDDGVFTRLGEPGKSIVVDVRIVVTTNKVLASVVKADCFLEDLYFRLKHWHLKTPALRDRPEDITLLADHYLRDFQRRSPNANDESDWFFAPQVMELFRSMPWPNNVRGLKSLVENIALFAKGNKSPINIQQATEVLLDPCADHNEHLACFTSDSTSGLKKLLDLTNGNISLVSRMTGNSRTTIYKRIKENGWRYIQ